MRFVAPEAVRIPLKNGTDWIEVKKELTAGEERAYRTKAFKRVSGLVDARDANRDPDVEVDWAQLAFARVEAYLVEWSEKRQITPEAIRALSGEDFAEIDALITSHIAAMSEEKKLPAGKSTETLPSA